MCIRDSSCRGAAFTLSMGLHRWHHRIDGSSSAHHTHAGLLSALHIGRTCAGWVLHRRNSRGGAGGIIPLLFLCPLNVYGKNWCEWTKNRAKSEDFHFQIAYFAISTWQNKPIYCSIRAIEFWSPKNELYKGGRFASVFLAYARASLAISIFCFHNLHR